MKLTYDHEGLRLLDAAGKHHAKQLCLRFLKPETQSSYSKRVIEKVRYIDLIWGITYSHLVRYITYYFYIGGAQDRYGSV